MGDWGSDPDDRRSTSGWCIYIGDLKDKSFQFDRMSSKDKITRGIMFIWEAVADEDRKK
ncbi:putative copia-type protein [Senna tora]|uniref:Putative copia-type protein n=1 Tax=Senna tora TaxID=362788 RepID=A0A835CFL5_9FABA|nr:putative copia-type protein [Senna tora]